MAQTYQGKTVRSSRPAREGDEGFVKDSGQVTISLDDGSEKTVKHTEVITSPIPGQSQSQK